MVNKSKNIGTKGETWVKRYAKTHGFPECDRRTQTGNKDQGDLLLQRHPRLGLLIAEVKAGNRAAGASDTLIEEWMQQADDERFNAHAAMCPLIWKRAGKGQQQVGSWWFAVRLSDLNPGDDAPVPPASVAGHIWRTTLDIGLLWLRAYGWGEPFGQPSHGAAGSKPSAVILDEVSCGCGQVGADDECVTGCRWDRP